MTRARDLASATTDIAVNTAKLAGIENDATIDQTPVEIQTAYDSVALVTLETEAVATYTINAADLNSTNILQIDFATDAIVTVPITPGDFIAGKSVTLRRKGDGAVTLLPAVGVTIESPDDLLVLRAKFSVATLVYQGADLWMLFGDLK